MTLVIPILYSYSSSMNYSQMIPCGMVRDVVLIITAANSTLLHGSVQHCLNPLLMQVCSLANFGNFQQACFLPVMATPYCTKCGNIWSTLGYYQMWLLLYSTKCGNIWSTLGYYQMWLLLYSTECGNIWSTLGYVATSALHQMWQHLEYPRILPNVATSVLHQMWQHLEYPGYYQMWRSKK